MTAGGRSWAEVKIQGGIFQGNAISSLEFVIAMMSRNHILWNALGAKFTESQENIYLLMYRDDIRLFTKNGKELETFTQAIMIYSQDIRMEFGI